MINDDAVEPDHKPKQHESAQGGVISVAIASVGDPQQEAERLKAVHESRVKIVPRSEHTINRFPTKKNSGHAEEKL
jgi:hypothetical protein